MSIKISIVTVCYNAVATIRSTIESVIEQTYPCIEYIIVDGKSMDGTLDIINSYGVDFLKVISEPDAGIYDAMNKGKANATGDYLLFLGADDVLADRAIIDRVVKRIRNCNSLAVVYGSVVQTKDGSVYDGRFSKWKWAYKNVCHQSIFYPYYIYKKFDYDKSYRLVSDWVYNLDLLKTGVHFEYIDEVITIYNNVSGVSSSKQDKVFLRNRKKLISAYVGYFRYYVAFLYKGFLRMKKIF